MFKTRQNYLLSCKNSKHFHCCEINKNFDITSDSTLENCLFRAVSLTKNVDIDLYKYSGYGNRFDRKGNFSFGNGFGRNCIFFAVDMSSSVHIDNKKGILILGEGPTQGLNGTTLLKVIRNFV